MNDKELLNLIKSRRSIRKFKDTPIKEEDLRDLIKAGIYAPSGSNTQCYRFMIIIDKEIINFLAQKKLNIIKNAPLIILCVADLESCPYLKSSRKEEFDKLPYQDCAMAIQNICLLAKAKGIASCVIHLSEKIRNAIEIRIKLNLSYRYELMGLILLGYPNEIVDYEMATHAGKPIKRKPIDFYILK